EVARDGCGPAPRSQAGRPLRPVRGKDARPRRRPPRAAAQVRRGVSVSERGGRASGLPALLEGASRAFMLDWLAKKKGVELVPIGDAVAALSRSEPERDFVNRNYGTPPSLAEALAPYRAAGLRPWFELPPGSEALERELVAAGA